jgi:hypothetical protein
MEVGAGEHRLYPVKLTLEERRAVLEIGDLENRTPGEQMREFVLEGIERRARLMRGMRQPMPA